MMGVAGYMEYYVQRHGNEAAFAYSLMSGGLIAIVLMTLVIRFLGRKTFKKKESAEVTAETEEEVPAEPVAVEAVQTAAETTEEAVEEPQTV